MRRPRHERLPVGQAGIWHLTSRCVRRQMLLQPAGRREWLAERLAAWCGVLAIDLLGYALMGNHVHLVVRTRPDRAQGWSAREVARRILATRAIAEGMPSEPSKAAVAAAIEDADVIAEARDQLSHPGVMLRAVKEGFARVVNRAESAAGHVWESRYHDVALIDAGGVLACLAYVDLNPFRDGLVTRPQASEFCSARHRLGVDASAADAGLGAQLAPLGGHPLLDGQGHARGSWAWGAAELVELTETTAAMLRGKSSRLPLWAEDLLPRLGIVRERWVPAMGRAGLIAGNVIGAEESRRRLAAGGRMTSDKTALFV
jgi:REP element-mobilizing transposase RayT